jgi:hypothetical protein
MTEELFFFRGFTRLKQLKHLIATHQIDADFYWRALEEQTVKVCRNGFHNDATRRRMADRFQA